MGRKGPQDVFPPAAPCPGFSRLLWMYCSLPKRPCWISSFSLITARMVVQKVSHHQNPFALLGQGHQGHAGFHIQAKGFFHIHVSLPAFRQVVVRSAWVAAGGGDGHRVYGLVRQNGLQPGLEFNLGIGLCHTLPGLGIGFQNTGQGPKLRKVAHQVFAPVPPRRLPPPLPGLPSSITSPVCIGFPAFIIKCPACQ